MMNTFQKLKKFRICFAVLKIWMNWQEAFLRFLWNRLEKKVSTRVKWSVDKLRRDFFLITKVDFQFIHLY